MFNNWSPFKKFTIFSFSLMVLPQLLMMSYSVIKGIDVSFNNVSIGIVVSWVACIFLAWSYLIRPQPTPVRKGLWSNRYQNELPREFTTDAFEALYVLYVAMKRCEENKFYSTLSFKDWFILHVDKKFSDIVLKRFCDSKLECEDHVLYIGDLQHFLQPDEDGYDIFALNFSLYNRNGSRRALRIEVRICDGGVHIRRNSTLDYKDNASIYDFGPRNVFMFKHGQELSI